MIFFKSRRQREFIIVDTMIRMYCTKMHASDQELCSSCHDLQEYARKRLDRCVFGELKPVCRECSVHCYSPQKREQMRIIMRWAGPRMIYAHPVYAIIHLFDSRNRSTIDRTIIKSE